MNLRQLLDHFKTELKDVYEEEEVRSIFALATAHITGLNRAGLMLNWDREPGVAENDLFRAVLAGLKTHKPIQYLLGEAFFYGSVFKVNESVLIPRPETEELIEWILESVVAPSAIIDFGTGSGCIAISLKKHLKDTALTAVDISKEAIHVATENAALNGAEVDFINADILNFRTEAKFDVIVSNPPYITGQEMAAMHQNVLAHEPHLALFVPDERPLLFYEAIADFAKSNLKEGGLLFFEINEHLGKETMEMLKGKSFTFIDLKKDMQGKDRMILARI